MSKWNDFLVTGKEVERQIAEQFTNTLYSKKHEDIKQGWDFAVQIKFDVKGAKKIRRSDPEISWNLTWLEYKNVNGDKGSLLKECDFFIFEREDCWDVKSKESSFNFFKEMAKETPEQWKSVTILNKMTYPKLYNVYQREKRQDIIMLVELDHELWPSTFKIPK